MRNLAKNFSTLFLLMAIFTFQLFSQQLAFPGAEGFGRYATGGRGGSVYIVTNLNDDGPGSFRDAVSQPNRIVVFEVGGVIHITNRIVVHRNITVAGQTAPGEGITIYGNGIAFNNDSGNNIIRYIRIRMGKNGDSGKDAVSISGGQNYIFDHVSISWGRDGTLDVNGTGIDNLTFQDCIIGQGINNSNHSTGGLMQSGKWSVIRSLYIDNKTRNPKARGTHEFINSVLYNWATHGYIMGDTKGLSECNLMGNYFIYGPSSSGGSHITGTTPEFHVYAMDNWVDENKDGILNGTLLTDYKTATMVPAPFDYPGVDKLLPAKEALDYIVENVGASKSRDAVDKLLIQQLTSFGTLGAIINTEDDNNIPGNVGTVSGGIVPVDTDRDGMPDEWELKYGFNIHEKAGLGQDTDGDGYTDIEEYINGTHPGKGTGYVPEGTYFLQARHSNKLLEVNDSDNTKPIEQAELKKKDLQAWKIEAIGDTCYKITNKRSGQAVSVDQGSLEEDGAIVVSDYHGGNDQLWDIAFLEDGYFSFINKKSNKAFTINNGSLANGTALVQSNFVDSAYQYFKLGIYESWFKPPIANIEKPVANSTFVFGQPVYIQANVEDYDGEITHVSFYYGDQKIAQDNDPPYRIFWFNAPVGTHDLALAATDNDGLVTTSSPVAIHVLGSGAQSIFIQENELGFCGVDGKVDNSHAGFSGNGFCDTDNAIGKGIDWKVKSPNAGNYTLTFRFANGASNRPSRLLVNGTEAMANIDMAGTGAWSTWQSINVKADLQAGTNTIRLEATTDGGLANIDYLEINSLDIEPVHCNGSDGAGWVYMEKYDGVEGTTVNDLLSCECFPAAPTTKKPISTIETKVGLDDNYGTRIRGFIKPPVTGNYTFWISGSDACQIWVNNKDSLPGGAAKIAFASSPTDIREWDKFPTQRSAPILLLDGSTKYYFEILHKAAVGNDHLAVQWQGPGFAPRLMGPEYIMPWTDGSHPGGVNLAIENRGAFKALRVYPNPANDILFVEIPEAFKGVSKVCIYNINGVLVRHFETNTNFASISIAQDPQCLYFVKVINKQGAINAKFTKM
jgi:hypothetical protein